MTRWWLPLLLGADTLVERAAKAAHVVRDEVLGATLSREEQEALTLATYERQGTYGPGGASYERGLYPWEQEALAMPCFAGARRVLVGAAGAGREALALVARGASVVAFEPCRGLVAQGKALAAVTPGLSFVEASYADLVGAVAGRGGPLSQAIEAGPFDAVILGWASLSHLLDGAERAALLAAARAAAPEGPTLVSFQMRHAPVGPLEARLRGAARRLLGGREEPPLFTREAGFFHLFTREEFEALAEATGHRIARLDDGMYPHAVLVPTRSPGRPGSGLPCR